MSTAADILVVDGLARHIPVKAGPFRRGMLKAVDGVSFSIREGETLGLVGESGCGKSTLGRMLVQLAPPSAGTLRFRGEPVIWHGMGRARPLRRHIQMVFQDPFASLNPHMTARQIVAEPLRNFGIARGAEADRLAADALDTCGIGRSMADRTPRDFSGGQRQRIGIARAVVIRPSLIVADEPVSALDVSIQAQVVNLLMDLQAEFRLTYLFISHDLSVVRYISGRVAVMYLGRLVEIAPAETLFTRPAHPYTRVLLSSIPIADPAAERRRQSIALGGELPSPMRPPSGCHFHTRCPWARLPLCGEVDPPVVELGGGQQAACHFAPEIGALPPGAGPA